MDRLRRVHAGHVRRLELRTVMAAWKRASAAHRSAMEDLCRGDRHRVTAARRRGIARWRRRVERRNRHRIAVLRATSRYMHVLGVRVIRAWRRRALDVVAARRALWLMSRRMLLRSLRYRLRRWWSWAQAVASIDGMLGETRIAMTSRVLDVVVRRDRNQSRVRLHFSHWRSLAAASWAMGRQRKVAAFHIWKMLSESTRVAKSNVVRHIVVVARNRLRWALSRWQRGALRRVVRDLRGQTRALEAQRRSAAVHLVGRATAWTARRQLSRGLYQWRAQTLHCAAAVGWGVAGTMCERHVFGTRLLRQTVCAWRRITTRQSTLRRVVCMATGLSAVPGVDTWVDGWSASQFQVQNKRPGDARSGHSDSSDDDEKGNDRISGATTSAASPSSTVSWTRWPPWLRVRLRRALWTWSAGAARCGVAVASREAETKAASGRDHQARLHCKRRRQRYLDTHFNQWRSWGAHRREVLAHGRVLFQLGRRRDKAHAFRVLAAAAHRECRRERSHFRRGRALAGITQLVHARCHRMPLVQSLRTWRLWSDQARRDVLARWWRAWVDFHHRSLYEQPLESRVATLQARHHLLAWQVAAGRSVATAGHVATRRRQALVALVETAMRNRTCALAQAMARWVGNDWWDTQTTLARAMKAWQQGVLVQRARRCRCRTVAARWRRQQTLQAFHSWTWATWVDDVAHGATVDGDHRRTLHVALVAARTARGRRQATALRSSMRRWHRNALYVDSIRTGARSVARALLSGPQRRAVQQWVRFCATRRILDDLGGRLRRTVARRAKRRALCVWRRTAALSALFIAGDLIEEATRRQTVTAAVAHVALGRLLEAEVARWRDAMRRCMRLWSLWAQGRALAIAASPRCIDVNIGVGIICRTHRQTRRRALERAWQRLHQHSVSVRLERQAIGFRGMSAWREMVVRADYRRVVLWHVLKAWWGRVRRRGFARWRSVVASQRRGEDTERQRTLRGLAESLARRQSTAAMEFVTQRWQRRALSWAVGAWRRRIVCGRRLASVVEFVWRRHRGRAAARGFLIWKSETLEARCEDVSFRLSYVSAQADLLRARASKYEQSQRNRLCFFFVRVVHRQLYEAILRWQAFTIETGKKQGRDRDRVQLRRWQRQAMAHRRHVLSHRAAFFGNDWKGFAGAGGGGGGGGGGGSRGGSPGLP